MRACEFLAEANLINTDAVRNNYLKLTAEHHMAGHPDLQAWFIRAGLRYIQQLPIDGDVIKPLGQGHFDDPRTFEENPWLQAALDRGEEVGYFSPVTPFHDRVRGMMDWLMAQQANGARLNLDRMSFAQALEHAERWHREMAERNALAATPSEDASGIQEMLKFADGFRWVRLTTAQALKREGNLMQHCVGQGGYTAQVKSGRTKIYSLRDPSNKPHCTIEVDQGEIQQCKGKQNEPPVEKYVPYVKSFLQSLKLPVKGATRDLWRAGLAQRRDGTIERLETSREEVTLPSGARAAVQLIEGDVTLTVFDGNRQIAMFTYEPARHNYHLTPMPDMRPWEVPLSDVQSVAEALNHISVPYSHVGTNSLDTYGLVHTGREWAAVSQGGGTESMRLDDGTQVIETESPSGHWYHFLRGGSVIQVCIYLLNGSMLSLFYQGAQTDRETAAIRKPWMTRNLPAVLNAIGPAYRSGYGFESLDIYRNWRTGQYGTPLEAGETVADLPGGYRLLRTVRTSGATGSYDLFWFDADDQMKAHLMIGPQGNYGTNGKEKLAPYVITALYPQVTRQLLSDAPAALVAGLNAVGDIGNRPFVEDTRKLLGSFGILHSRRNWMWRLGKPTKEYDGPNG